MAPQPIYIVRTFRITTGNRIEAFRDSIRGYKNKGKALLNAYHEALKYAKWNGLPINNDDDDKYDCVDSLTITEDDIKGIEEEYIDLGEESNNKKRPLKKGILKISNYYSWPSNDAYNWKRYCIQVFEDFMDFEAPNGIIYKKRFGN